MPEYVLPDLWEDTQSGHNIVKTVFMECGAEYHRSGPDHLKAVGETEFVQSHGSGQRCTGQGGDRGYRCTRKMDTDQELLKETLQAHETAGGGLFKGIRHGGAHDPGKNLGWMNATPHADLFSRDAFRRGVTLLGELGYSYDSWHYHFQNDAFTDLAIACSGTTIVLDHFGTPCGVGDFAGDMGAVFDQWKTGISRMAQCPNVVVKIGGLAMPVNGLAGTNKTGRRPPMRLWPPIETITCTPSTPSVRRAACLRATFQ